MKNHTKTFTQVSQQKSKRKMIEQGLKAHAAGRELVQHGRLNILLAVTPQVAVP